ncbi:hypothetical protein EVAR_21259_1 [Eumeta japonica]|uniref:Uncharacterized protein n=1 Tax=Eumeta variegata TaxID=151549 RepID=A0A4C1WL14_EUMVA|nr:hypothetical protein EVAR_21259_1 [Eumeta japonica]
MFARGRAAFTAAKVRVPLAPARPRDARAGVHYKLTAHIEFRSIGIIGECVSGCVTVANDSCRRPPRPRYGPRARARARARARDVASPTRRGAARRLWLRAILYLHERQLMWSA